VADREIQAAQPLAHAVWLTAPATQAVMAALRDAGFAVRVVGGAVRNSLLGRPVSDVDMATTARPEQVIAAAAVAGLKTAATGLKHGTVTVIAAGRPFEVTTLRRDVATDGRHATVAFTDDWAADAARRDLTINALYCDADGTLFDPLGGSADLRAGAVRFIGDPAARIAEDYLRILRFFRFTAEYAAGAPDAAGVVAAVAGRAGLHRLSAERVRAELLRLLAAVRAVPVIEVMAAHGLLTAILPVAPRPGGLARLVAIETAQGCPADPILRLASLAIAAPEDGWRLAKHLRLSTAERDRLVAAGGTKAIDPGQPPQQHRAALYRLGRTAFMDQVLIDWSRTCVRPDDAGWRDLLRLSDRWTPPSMPFAGRDLQARGIAPGPRMGELLARFETWWIDADFPGDPAALDATLARLIADC
jgi:poly(A) polymerase